MHALMNSHEAIQQHECMVQRSQALVVLPSASAINLDEVV